jgi:hypothetical protein
MAKTYTIRRIVPRRAGSGEPQAAGKVTVDGTSSAEITIPGSGVDDRTITLKPTTNCHIAFGVAGMAAADVTDLLFFGSQTDEYVVPRDVTTMRVIMAAGATAGFLSWHVSTTL